MLRMDGSIERVNRAALELLGYARGDILEQPVGPVLVEDTAFSVIARLRPTNRITGPGAPDRGR
ncbi:PAS domain-containing protein [Sorangium sp. So ce1014]|uniref:PAS domain-containing protein n=1 Tax=Sorangium sp. So ce1014 TaxID=3133326 RepID=UPI003F5DF91F